MKNIKNQRQYQHIIWDWNGTLLNDGWLFVDIMNSILMKRSIQKIATTPEGHLLVSIN